MKKKLYKVLSVVLSVTLLLSVCFVSGAFNVFAEESLTDYYVGYGGTGDGSTKANMAPTVAEAIKTINANGLKAGDTANIWIVQDIDVIKNVGMKGNRALHNAAAWMLEGGTMEAHTAKIIVQAHPDNQKNNPSLAKTYLLGDETVSSQAWFVLTGPTEFKNIELVWNSSSNYYQGGGTGGTHIASEGNDLIIGEGVTYSRMNHNGNNASQWVSGTYEAMGNLATSIAIGFGTYTKPFKMSFYNKQSLHANRIDVPGYDRQDVINSTFNEDVTLEFNNPDMGTYLRIGGTVEGRTTATFNKNLNIKVMDTYQVRLENGKNKVTVLGGVQVIMGKGSIPSDYAPSRLTAAVKLDGTTPADKWILTTSKANAKYIDFIEGVTGKFKVPANCVAVATDASGNTYTSDNDGVLNLAGLPGEYTVDITVYREKVYDYYVKFGGTGDGSSIDAPAPDVATAIATINECRLNEKETATIHIMQNITAFENNTTDNNVYYHNLVSWGSTVEHAAKIVIKPYKDNTYNDTVTNTYIATSTKVGDAQELIIGGPTEFQNIAIVFPYGSNIGKWNPVNANGNDLTYSNGTTFRYIPVNSSNESAWNLTLPAQSTYTGIGTAMGLPNVVYNNPLRVNVNYDTGIMAQTISFPYNWPGANDVFTFKNDVTLDINGANGITVSFGTITSGATATFEKNINIKETASTNLRYDTATSSIVVKGGLQVIANTAAGHHETRSIENARAMILKADGSQADFWKLNVGPEYVGYIDFAEGETGKFKVAGNCEVKAVNVADESLVYNVGEGEGVLDLAGLPGEYNLEFTVFADKVYDYYVKAGGTGDGSSVDAPAPDVATAIKTINVRRLVKGETATIHVMQDIKAIEATSATSHNLVVWGETVAHEATVVIKAYEGNTYTGTVKDTIISTSAALGSNNAIVLGGPTEFEDVLLLFPYGSSIAIRMPFNFNGESGKLSANTKFAYFDGVNSGSYSSWAQASIPADLTTIMKNISMFPVYTSNATEGQVFNDPARIEVNVPYSSTADNCAILVIGEGAGRFKEDMTVVLDLLNSYNPRIRMGLYSGGSVFEKNLNIKLKAGTHVGFSDNQPLYVNGGVHYILSTGVSFHTNNPYNNLNAKIFKEGTEEQADMWLLKVEPALIDTVDFVEGQTGKFKAELKGRIAVATKVVAEGEAAGDPIVADSNGILDLSGAPGEYTIAYVSEFSADGEAIRVYKDMELDLAKQKHNEYLGKMFIGWKYRGKDEYPQAVNGVAKIKAGSILEAQYIDIAETDFQLEDIQLRADGNANDPAIRFVINKNKAFEGKINPTQYGAIFMEADKAQGFEIFMDKSPVVAWYAYANESGNNEEWAVRETTGYKPYTFVADPEKILEETDTDTKYSVCLTGISEANYRTFYALRGFIKFLNKNGVESIAYTEQEVSSIYKEACDTNDTAVEDRTEAQLEIIAKAEANKAAKKQELMNGLMTPAEYGVQMGYNGQAITDAEALEKNAIIYTTNSYGKQYMRSITIDTGMDVEATDLLFVTDVHVTYSNEKDIALGYQNALGYYMSRAYYGSTFNSRSTYSALAIHSANLASLFDKVVVGGDVADYVSYGNFESIKRIWSDRSIMTGNSLKGTISITPGNHEGSQSSATPAEKMDGDVLHAFQNKYLISNSEIDYDIVYKADGKTPNYMTVTIDNASTSATYTEAQYEALSQYLAYAKELNIPVLLFQHIPMATWNEADAEYWYTAPEYLRFEAGGHQPHPAVYKQWLKWKSEHPNATASEKAKYADTLYAAGTNDYGEEYPRGWQFANAYDGSGFAGYSGDTETALKVRQLITSNSDTIKAIITGHNHSDYETGVVATDAQGNKLRDNDGNYITIPQFTTAAGYQHGSMIVNIK